MEAEIRTDILIALVKAKRDRSGHRFKRTSTEKEGNITAFSMLGDHLNLVLVIQRLVASPFNISSKYQRATVVLSKQIFRDAELTLTYISNGIVIKALLPRASEDHTNHAVGIMGMLNVDSSSLSTIFLKPTSFEERNQYVIVPCT